MHRSAPWASGFCWNGPRNVLSTTTSGLLPWLRPVSAATRAISAMSAMPLVGLAGVSTIAKATRPSEAACAAAARMAASSRASSMPTGVMPKAARWP